MIRALFDRKVAPRYRIGHQGAIPNDHSELPTPFDLEILFHVELDGVLPNRGFGSKPIIGNLLKQRAGVVQWQNVSFPS